MKAPWLVLLAACGSSDDGPTLPPPIAEVPGTLARLAIHDTSLFSVDLDTNDLIELGHDGTMIGTIPATGEVRGLVAHGDVVAWVEVEGSGTVVKRRRGAGGAIEAQRTFDAHVIANAEGLFYSDLGLIASWGDGNPERIATPVDPTTSPRLLDVDASFAYAEEADTSIVEYALGSDASEAQLTTSLAATVRNGQLAYRGEGGIRLRDLFSGFDRVVGFVPTDYECELLIVETAVMCGRFRAINGNADELLADPVTGYTARGRDVFWVTSTDGVSAIHVSDAETAGE